MLCNKISLKLRDGIDLGVVKQDMGAARIAMLQKELRGAIKQIQDEKVSF